LALIWVRIKDARSGKLNRKRFERGTELKKETEKKAGATSGGVL